MKAIIYISAILLLTGCVTQRRCADKFPCVASDTIVWRVDTIVDRHDSSIYVPADSSMTQMLIDCQDGKAKLIQVLKTQNGTRTSAPVVYVHDNILTAQCIVDSSQIFTSWFHRYIVKSSKEVKTVIKITNVLTGWQQFWTRLGYVFFGIIILAIIALGFKLMT